MPFVRIAVWSIVVAATFIVTTVAWALLLAIWWLLRSL
jgi:hypothetical protein